MAAPDHTEQGEPTVSTESSHVRTLALGGLVVVVLLVVIGAVWFIRWGNSPSSSSSDFTCMAWGTGQTTEEYCTRAAADAARRSSLSDAELNQAQEATDEIERALGRVGRCITAEGHPCSGRVDRHPPTDADADAVVRALKQAGHENGVARVARSTDPAPTGSLLYAVSATDRTCVVGYLLDIPDGAGGKTVLGKLPSGRCLDD